MWFHGKIYWRIDINWPGRTHDVKVLANSRINNVMQEGKIPKMFRVLLPGRDEVPLLLLGDPLYPLLSHCLKEYSTCYSNEDVMLIPCWELSARNNKKKNVAYGRLQARWQILTKATNFKLEDIPQLKYACFVMHNYCELNNTAPDEQSVQRFMDLGRENQEACSGIHNTSTVGGTRARSVLTDYLKRKLRSRIILPYMKAHMPSVSKNSCHSVQHQLEF